jgi:hypothetical protein
MMERRGKQFFRVEDKSIGRAQEEARPNVASRAVMGVESHDSLFAQSVKSK